MCCSFTYSHYQEILALAKKMEYTVMGCHAFIQNNRPQNAIVMRHDVDAHPKRAYDIAKIEAEAGVASTYFFRVFSNDYNLFGYDTVTIVREIEKLGHEIGYHAEPVDVSAATGGEVGYTEAFFMGKKALELLLGHPVAGVASHREATGYNNLKQFLEKMPAESLNIQYEAYDSTHLDLFSRSCYVTDGYEWYWRSFLNGALTEETCCVCEVIKRRRDSQIYCLTHPNSWYQSHYHRVHT